MSDAPGWLLDLRGFLLAFGLPGLGALAFFDSGVVGVPAGPDALVMLLSWRDPPRAWLVAATAAVGAIAGGVLRYSLARKAGELALRRFDPARRAWAHRAIDNHGIWTVFLACLAPPPFPLSFVMIAAGACQMRLLPFLAGTIPGRAARYGLLAWLGVHFGRRAAGVFAEYLPLVLVAIVLAGIAIAALLLLKRGPQPLE